LFSFLFSFFFQVSFNFFNDVNKRFGCRRIRFRAYVGIANKLRQRIDQHLLKRDSSVATGTSVATLNPDYVTEVEWWTHPKFTNRDFLGAAEKVAFDLFQPTLRSRGNIPTASLKLYEMPNFQKEMKTLFDSPPSGKIIIPTLLDAMKRIEKLENDLANLKSSLRSTKK